MDRCGTEAPVGHFPVGGRRADGGTNSSVWSRTAGQLDLRLVDDVDDARPSRVIPLEPLRNRASYFWHVLVPDVEPGGGPYLSIRKTARPASSTIGATAPCRG
jgi:pullulanase/glycogen debranching enzyme